MESQIAAQRPVAIRWWAPTRMISRLFVVVLMYQGFHSLIPEPWCFLLTFISCFIAQYGYTGGTKLGT